MIKTSNAFIDITHIVYPKDFTLVRTAIEKIKPGELLEIRLNFGKSLLKIPRSLEAAGHRTLYISDNRDGTYTALIEKRV